MYDRVAVKSQGFSIQIYIPVNNKAFAVCQGQVFCKDSLYGAVAHINIVEFRFDGVEDDFQRHVLVTVVRLSDESYVRSRVATVTPADPPCLKVTREIFDPV